MTSKLVWTGIATGVAGTATAVYLAREQIADFAVKTASKAAVKAAVKAPVTIANQAAHATVGKATETVKDAGKTVNGITNKLPAQAAVGKVKETAKDTGKLVSGVTNKLPGKLNGRH